MSYICPTKEQSIINQCLQRHTKLNEMIDLMSVKSKYDGKEILINVHHIAAIYEQQNGNVEILLTDGGVFEVEGTLENIRLNVLHTMRVR